MRGYFVKECLFLLLMMPLGIDRTKTRPKYKFFFWREKREKSSPEAAECSTFLSLIILYTFWVKERETGHTYTTTQFRSTLNRSHAADKDRFFSNGSFLGFWTHWKWLETKLCWGSLEEWRRNQVNRPGRLGHHDGKLCQGQSNLVKKEVQTQNGTFRRNRFSDKRH